MERGQKRKKKKNETGKRSETDRAGEMRRYDFERGTGVDVCACVCLAASGSSCGLLQHSHTPSVTGGATGENPLQPRRPPLRQPFPHSYFIFRLQKKEREKKAVYLTLMQSSLSASAE